jgi:hypothetical protein
MPDIPKHLLIYPLMLIGLWPATSWALDYVSVRREGTDLRIEGRPLVVAQDGGMMLQARDGTIWLVQPEETTEHRSDDVPFAPYTADELGERVLKELPAGFAVHRTARYVVCYNTSRAYAEWCGSLFERLYMAFTNYWTKKDFELVEPEFPLVAIVFDDKRSYTEFARKEVGDAAGQIVAYFSLTSNRMVMYDLTGLEAREGMGRSLRSRSQINQLLSRPGAVQTVSTIVHEATHQIAFNCGLHARFSDCPLWFSEGIAVFFETPDVKSSRGWKGIGSVNQPRLARFRDYLSRRPANSLETLLTDDTRLRGSKTAPDAYAEAWALTYFLSRRYPSQYIAYIKLLSAKKPQHWDDANARLADFKATFGDDLGKLDTEFVRSMIEVR